MKRLFLLFGILLLLGCDDKAEDDLTVQVAADVNYIVLEMGVDNINEQANTRVAFYIPVADSNNFAGNNFRAALLQSGLGGSSLTWLTGALLDSVNVGAFIEKIETISFTAGLTKAQKRTVIDERYNALKTEEIDKFYAKYDFWGLERIVP